MGFVRSSKQDRHANGNWADDRKGAALHSFQTFTLGLGQTVVPNH